MFKILTTFKTVYETKNFTTAAQLLFLSQPTVSVQIKQLEDALGVTLFERNGRQQMTPTKSADLFYQQAQQLLDLWDQDLHALHHQDGQPKTPCRIGASHTTAIYLLPTLLKAHRPALETLALYISTLNSSQIVQELTQHKLDFGFIEKPLTEKDLIRTPLQTDQLVLAGRPNEPWLLREQGSGVYHYTMNYVKENNLPLENVMTIKSNAMIIQLLRQGIGQSLVSSAALLDYPEIPYRPLSQQYQRQFYLVARKNLPAPIQSFIALLMATPLPIE
ncbi:LysR family transcriptional regulator [Latilactobacillus curvatus]|uniref:LysR family transcriptional regulator n=1 Tax=Latilactobacillus curvatus TaxID=28038 RepID=UPI0009776297|nr:LysR family transcriptional regulator [Latilactobacillus curvatus]AZP96708.1 LysR family transcriptional regulator [Latilactobacillus curvatus]MCT1215156.1 LysR family transcriptional regulator [Latilactobacillus curvatus]UTC14125.1 LysR family transcriptional regulator [Latilactobacillus curvatus]WRS47009.1 LysR family transcriptional regulator [Latilactobacillus curvatus]